MVKETAWQEESLLTAIIHFEHYDEAREQSEPFFPWFSKEKKASSQRVVRA